MNINTNSNIIEKSNIIEESTIRIELNNTLIASTYDENNIVKNIIKEDIDKDENIIKKYMHNVDDEDIDENEDEDIDENEDEDIDENEDEDIDENEDEDIAEENCIKLLNYLINTSSNEPSNTLNNQVKSLQINDITNEIMTIAYKNIMIINESIIQFINLCYLRNLKYYNEPIEIIRYTIRTIINIGVRFEIEQLVANVLSYSLNMTNIIFNNNFDLLNDIIKNEIRRFLRRRFIINAMTHLMTFDNTMELEQIGYIKSILLDEELNKSMIKMFENIELETKNRHKNNYMIHDDILIFKPKFNKPIDEYATLIQNYTRIIFSNYEDLEILFTPLEI